MRLPRLAPKLALARTAIRAFLSTRHPVLVHMIPIRRCNLACEYCNEYDAHSPPVPTDRMLARIDHAAELGTSILTFSGGEPLLHPDLDDLVARAAHHGMVPELLTNAFLLGPDRIRRLNDAGLLRMQISIDNAEPDEVSKKSLRTIGPKLEHLASHARFDVNVNSVIGAGIPHPRDALLVARRARDLGFTSTVGVIHDADGQLRPLGPEAREVYEELRGPAGWPVSRFMAFKDNLARGEPNEWRCRAGARYLYVCEKGLVHRCSQQRGDPGIPFLEYGEEHMAAEYRAEKACAPMCTVSCAHAVSVLDGWRDPQVPDAGAAASAPGRELTVLS